MKMNVPREEKAMIKRLTNPHKKKNVAHLNVNPFMQGSRPDMG